MAEKTKINQAHWFGDIAISATSGIEKEFHVNVDILSLEFKALPGIHHYVLEINKGAFQGTGAEVAGAKKISPGATLTINHYNVKKITVTSHDASGGPLAIGEVGYMGFMTNMVNSYLVVTP